MLIKLTYKKHWRTKLFKVQVNSSNGKRKFSMRNRRGLMKTFLPLTIYPLKKQKLLKYHKNQIKKMIQIKNNDLLSFFNINSSSYWHIFQFHNILFDYLARLSYIKMKGSFYLAKIGNSKLYPRSLSVCPASIWSQLPFPISRIMFD
jgi:hypothetical protein